MSSEAYLNGGNFPGFSPEAAKWLLEKDIVGIGIDTPSLDPGTHKGEDPEEEASCVCTCVYVCNMILPPSTHKGEDLLNFT
jgi:kynurenine formamidase